MITDFDRNPFYFFRGPSPASHLTAYWTNDIVLARHRNSKEILKANVSVRNPLIVDCKNTGWDQPEKNKVTLYPKKARKDFISFSKSYQYLAYENCWPANYDVFLEKYKDTYDAVILKDVHEGHSDIVYDLIIIDETLLSNVNSIDICDATINKYPVKIPDLSPFLR